MRPGTARSDARTCQESSSDALTKMAQNPMENLISVRFRENANLNVGTYDKHHGGGHELRSDRVYCG
jgi:hypothetical protein